MPKPRPAAGHTTSVLFHCRGTARLTSAARTRPHASAITPPSECQSLTSPPPLEDETTEWLLHLMKCSCTVFQRISAVSHAETNTNKIYKSC